MEDKYCFYPVIWATNGSIDPNDTSGYTLHIVIKELTKFVDNGQALFRASMAIDSRTDCNALISYWIEEYLNLYDNIGRQGLIDIENR